MFKQFGVCFESKKEIYSRAKKKKKKKKTRKFVTLKLKIKQVEFKKCMLQVKLTVYYTFSFTCNIHFLNSTYFISNQFKSNKLSRFFYCCIYIDIVSFCSHIVSIKSNLKCRSENILEM